jgi:hypothetical protein
VAEEERRRKSAAGIGRKAGFLAYFGPDFLLLQDIKSTSIYMQWKRKIFSTMRKNSSLNSVGKDPNH